VYGELKTLNLPTRLTYTTLYQAYCHQLPKLPPALLSVTFPPLLLGETFWTLA
jgi:hypothetical protein